MSGFFKIDIDDFDETWTQRENAHLFPVYCELLRQSWRQDKPSTARVHHYEVTLWMNQLVLRTRRIARLLDLAETTCRDHLRRLEDLGIIRIDKPEPRITIATVLWAYTYGDHGCRTPCIYRAPSVIDTRTCRSQFACDPSNTSTKANNDNNLRQPNTDTLEDCRQVDEESQNILVKKGVIGDRDVTSEFRIADGPSQKLEENISALSAMYIERDSSLTVEQAVARARSILQGDLERWLD